VAADATDHVEVFLALRAIVLQGHLAFLTIEYAVDISGLIGSLQLCLHIKIYVYVRIAPR
jgi:hypothetical protein